jgi:hypothetical protein
MADDKPREVAIIQGAAVGKTAELRHTAFVPGRRSGQSLLLAAAVQAAISSPQPAETIRLSLFDALRAQGTPLAGLKVFGVPEGHEHYPEAKTFKVVGNCCYVRSEDFPKLQAALARQRALRRGPSEPVSKRETDE